MFVVLGRMFGRSLRSTRARARLRHRRSAGVHRDPDQLNAVLSLVTIISIYREGGILKRLRATPLRPLTILTAHVIVKLLILNVITMSLMVMAGRRYYPVEVGVSVAGFTLAMLITTLSILSIGFSSPASCPPRGSRSRSVRSSCIR